MNYDLFIYVQNITHYIVLFMNNPSSCGRIPAGNLSHKSNSTMAHLTSPKLCSYFAVCNLMMVQKTKKIDGDCGDGARSIGTWSMGTLPHLP